MSMLRRIMMAILFMLLVVATSACSHSERQQPVIQRENGEVQEWTCSMHPQIRQPKPGRCPICGMDLIPVLASGAATAKERELELSPTMQALAEVETAPVERRPLSAEVRWVGKVAANETLVRDVTLLVAGRIERLHANYEGMPIRRGDPLAEIYSPDVAAGMQELLIAKETSQISPSVLESARTKLLRLGVSAEEVEGIAKGEVPRETFTLRSPSDGIIAKIYVREKGWIEAGQTLLQLTDLSSVWVLLDAYESDLGLLRTGLIVRFAVEALPGTTFTGHVSFVSPVLEDSTRSVPVRLEAENPGGVLRPGMFVRAQAFVPIASEGEMPLLIPASAPLITGRRAIVYVATGPGRYEGREIELGRRAGDYYVVTSGLSEGEQVVVKGAMKIDSTLQLQARPSMMNPEGGATSPSHTGHKSDSATQIGHYEQPGVQAIEGRASSVSPPSEHGSVHQAGQAAISSGRPQTICPIMGGPINRQLFADYQGYRVYFCCAGCIDEFQRHPEKYVRQMQEQGIQLEMVPKEAP